MKTTSLTALVAATGLLMGTPANAADLGGGCCADLEARVAELEATTARKGNRVVSLQVYGQVNKALLIWDDGIDSDGYVVDYDASGTRIGFKGSASMRPGWTAGYLIELDIQDAASNKVDHHSSFDDPSDEIKIRYGYWYIESENLGRLTVGQAAPATNSIDTIVLGGSLSDASLSMGNSFRIRTTGGGTSSINWGSAMGDMGKGRNDVIRYDSPSLHGFIISASWGDDDFADVALRFKREWNSVRLAFGIGYQSNADASVDSEVIAGSLSLMHVPTGVYVAFAGGETDFEPASSIDRSYWYGQLGIERRWFHSGSTTLFVDYGAYEDYVTAGDGVDRWSFGFVQRYDAAAMEIYGRAQFLDYDDATTTSFEGLSTFIIGSRIKF